MRLADLNPRWFSQGADRRGQGLTFDCPHCVAARAEHPTRLGVAFVPTLDGGAPIGLNPKQLWPALWPESESDGPKTTTVPPGIHWQRAGDTFDTLTLSPSVDASASGHWHGFIVNGEIR